MVNLSLIFLTVLGFKSLISTTKHDRLKNDGFSPVGIIGMQGE